MTTRLPHILIVDDEPVNLEILSDFMFERHYMISTATDGLMAWEMLEADPELYDVILLDRMMPRMNGLQVLNRIKAHPILSHCPVIFSNGP